MSKNVMGIIVALLAIIFLGSQCLFVVHQTQQALVLQLGNPKDRVYSPGLHFKLPFIQNVLYFDARILDYDARPAEALTSDLKTTVLDHYARWRIVDPLLFYRTLRIIPDAQARLDAVVYSQMRAHVGRHTLTEVVTTQRMEIMSSVTLLASQQMQEFGIEVVDARIKRTDLPVENQLAIYGRMQAERERQAKQYRSEGQEEATKIRSTADMQRTVILAEAELQAQILRGVGDAEAASIFAAAFAQSPEFFEFQRGLEAARKALNANTSLVLTPDHPILRSLQ